MTSHVRLIIGSETNPLAYTMCNFKSYTSCAIRLCMEEHGRESCKEWVLWMMKRAGLKNSR